LVGWAASLERRLGRPVTAWSVEPKLDGLAIAARYRDGRLTQLVTRGYGTKGEDVSHAIGTIVGLPARLAEPVTVELRGEVMFPVKFICSGPRNSCRAEVAGPRRTTTARADPADRRPHPPDPARTVGPG
jgi:NAD-dependent DNA ligase